MGAGELRERGRGDVAGERAVLQLRVLRQHRAAAGAVDADEGGADIEYESESE